MRKRLQTNARRQQRVCLRQLTLPLPVQHSRAHPSLLCRAQKSSPAHIRPAWTCPVCTQSGLGALALEAAGPFPFPQIKNPAMPSVAGMRSVPGPLLPAQVSAQNLQRRFPPARGKIFQRRRFSIVQKGVGRIFSALAGKNATFNK